MLRPVIENNILPFINKDIIVINKKIKTLTIYLFFSGFGDNKTTIFDAFAETEMINKIAMKLKIKFASIEEIFERTNIGSTKR